MASTGSVAALIMHVTEAVGSDRGAEQEQGRSNGEARQSALVLDDTKGLLPLCVKWAHLLCATVFYGYDQSHDRLVYSQRL